MALVNFTDLDFDQIKTSLTDYLRENSDFTDYDFEGSNLSNIIDVLAYNTYINSYNANMISNEVFIDSATLRENVVALARNIGYTPRSRTCAKAIISFFVDTTGFTTKPVTVTLRKGIVATSASVFGSESYSFSLPSDITVPVVDGIATFRDVVIYEGTFLTSNFTVSAENPAPPSRYTLEEEVTSIKVSENTYFLEEVLDWVSLTITSRVEVSIFAFSRIYRDGGAGFSDESVKFVVKYVPS